MAARLAPWFAPERGFAKHDWERWNGRGGMAPRLADWEHGVETGLDITAPCV